MSDKILSIQNTRIETLGTLKKLIESDGYEIKSIEAKTDGVPDDPRQYAAVVILGGYMSVYENLAYLNKEQELIRNAQTYGIPVLGICLGSQLIAQALGGRVYKGKKKEIGWFDVTLNDEGRMDIFKGINTKNIRVFQWHGDTYDLPKTATLLASSELYPQAFRIGTAIGILFHLEVEPEMIQEWTKEYSLEMKQGAITIEDILIHRKNEFENLVNKCQVVYTNFSKMISHVTHNHKNTT
ncbi:MAG: type 1 glutamine amidotransferase [Nitrososphaerota archaeon]